MVQDGNKASFFFSVKSTCIFTTELHCQRYKWHHVHLCYILHYSLVKDGVNEIAS